MVYEAGQPETIQSGYLQYLKLFDGVTLAVNHSFQVDLVLTALRKILPASENYPLHEPLFCGNENKYVQECIDTGWVSSVGKFVDRFEADLAAYTGVKQGWP